MEDVPDEATRTQHCLPDSSSLLDEDSPGKHSLTESDYTGSLPRTGVTGSRSQSLHEPRTPVPLPRGSSHRGDPCPSLREAKKVSVSCTSSNEEIQARNNLDNDDNDQNETSLLLPQYDSSDTFSPCSDEGKRRNSLSDSASSRENPDSRNDCDEKFVKDETSPLLPGRITPDTSSVLSGVTRRKPSPMPSSRSQGSVGKRSTQNQDDGHHGEATPLLGHRACHAVAKTSPEDAPVSLGSTLCRLLPVSLMMGLYGCASAVHTPLLSLYLYSRYAELHGLNSTRHSPAGGSGCVNVSVRITPDEALTQEDSAAMLVKMSLLTGVPAIFTTMLLGTYADVLGRRKTLLVMLCGRLGRDALISAVVFYHLDLRLFMVAYAIDGLFGSFFSFFLANFAYTADITPNKRIRAIAMTTIGASMGAAEAGLSYAAGYIIKTLGFAPASTMPAIFDFVSFPIVLFCLKNTLEPRAFSFIAPWKVFQFYVVKKPGRDRGLFCLGGLTFVLLVLQGMSAVNTLYQMGPPFCWNSEQVGLYGTVRDLSVYLLSVPLGYLLQCCFRVEMVALVGILTLVARHTVTALATTSLTLYLAGAVGFGYGLVFPTLRSLLSCLVEPEEQGTLFASLAVVEVGGYLAGSTLSSRIYEATLDAMPGAIYLALAACSLVAFLLMAIFMKKTQKSLEKKCQQTHRIQA